MQNALLENIKRIRAIAEIGLLYNQNDFDRERYHELKNISFRMMSELTGQPMQSIRETYLPVDDYPTAKVDVRGLILNADKQILMVKEGVDGRWTLPGGWADIGSTPREMVIRECKEESGLDVEPTHLLAVFDKREHPHPPQPHYVYKLVFLCEPLTSEMAHGFDMLDVQYFDINELPPLSEDRILENQLRLLYKKVQDSDWETYVD